MTKMKLSLSALSACLFIFVFATAGQAAPRTFVSGSGSDANAPGCTFTLPCRFLSTAYANTDVGGEIIALTPAGYGGLAITKAITVQAIPGQWGFISVVASSSGISVAAGASENVVIRNLQFSATPSLAASSVGITHTSGKLTVENCTFTQLSMGLLTTAKANVLDCMFSGNTVGLKADGTGTDTQVFPIVWGPVQLRISGGDILNNTTGVIMANPGYRGCPSGFTCGCGPGQGPPLNQDNKLNVFFHLTGGSSSEVLTNVAGNGTYFTGSGASCTSAPDCAAATHAICSGPGTYNFGTNPN